MSTCGLLAGGGTLRKKKQQLRAPLQARIQKIKMKAPSTGPSKSSDSFATKLRDSSHSYGSDHVSLRKLHIVVPIKSILISRWYHRSDRRQSCTQVLIILSGTVLICLIIIPCRYTDTDPNTGKNRGRPIFRFSSEFRYLS